MDGVESSVWEAIEPSSSGLPDSEPAGRCGHGEFVGHQSPVMAELLEMWIQGFHLFCPVCSSVPRVYNTYPGIPVGAK